MSRGSRRPNLALRRRLLLACWIAAALAILGRSVELQLLEGAAWKEQATRQHRKTQTLAGARGRILDRHGAALAVSQEAFRVSLAPHELDDAGRAGALLQRVLKLPRGDVLGAVRSSRPWVVLPGRYSAVAREALAGMDGVYVDRQLRRYYPNERLAGGILGRVSDGRGAGGIEETWDEVLRGRAGREVVARDHQGRPIPGESWVVEPPRSGGEVTLTLDLDLQEIGYEALTAALERTGARGGDLLVTDPRTGEILAMVSLGRRGEVRTLSAINTPYEPGSILKPFTVAGLLARGLAALEDTVDAEAGAWRVAGRTVHDIHPAERISVAEALRTSSNVGIAKAAGAFTPGEQYQNLRDFGFGTPTGVALPGEAAGTLRRPDRWSGQSPVSLAIGYEISVTPIQMAMAYGALANGGRLMEPRLIREVRGPDGELLERREPRLVRGVVPQWVTSRLTPVLVDVVEDGTGSRARMATFQVAGKSGTTRAHGGPGGYERGSYFSSFVGFFPADDPQLVVFVKLDRPRGTFYGGATAAPVTRATLEAVLSVRRPPLDRRALVTGVGMPEPRPPASPPSVRFASLTAEAPPSLSGSAAERGDGGAVRVRLSRDGVPVPEVRGLPARTAVRRLHALGLHVSLTEPGEVRGTEPRAGSRLLPGDTVRLLTRGVGP